MKNQKNSSAEAVRRIARESLERQLEVQRDQVQKFSEIMVQSRSMNREVRRQVADIQAVFKVIKKDREAGSAD